METAVPGERSTRVNPLRAAGAVVVALLVYYGIQLLTVVLQIYPHLGLPAEWTQPGNWVQLTDHHLWQMLLALVMITLLSRGRLSEWGLNLQQRQESIRLFRRFVLYFGVYFVAVGFALRLAFAAAPPLDFPPTAANVAGMLAFRGLLSGLSEEILFRGLLQTGLTRWIPGAVRVKGLVLSTAGVVTALVFAAVHIDLRLYPFEIVHIYWPQLVLAFVLGLFYAYAYERTSSLLAPVLAHNFSNASLYAADVLLVSAA